MELEWLDISKTKCGDTGMAALAAALPTSVKAFTFNECDVGDGGWIALAQDFPLESGRNISGRYSNPGMGRLAAQAWATSLAQMTSHEEWSHMLDVSLDTTQ
eukprot:COSAG01_NODE_12325_length_1759_cov_1.301807_1_plen_101_part_10